LQRVLTSVTLLGLLVLTAAAFAITERLKQMKSPIFGTQITNSEGLPTKQFSPICHCPNSVARLTIRLRHPDHVTVTIVDAGFHEVATVPSPEKNLGARAPQHFPWDGREADGSLAPDGVYYPWVYLAHARRTFKFINKITIDTKPPNFVQPPSVGKPTLFAGGDRTAAIHYAFNEPAHAVVYLGGRQIIVGRHTKQGSKAKVTWAGKVHGRPLPAGTYVLSVGGRDIAGNETPAAQRKNVTVVVRYVELTPKRIAVGRRGRIKVHVETALRRYKWRLGRRHGERRGKVLRLRAPSTPGTYRLVVGEPGRSATAVVRVHG
jgi:hypothetical protein